MGYSLIMFKDIIKDLRESQELSQYELAKALQVSQSAIAKWELGKTEPHRICTNLNIKVF